MNEQLLKAAKEVLEKNWTGQFTKPAPSLYPHQWNWDAGFIAIGYAHYDTKKAMSEMQSLFRGQWSNGFLPHIVFRSEPETDAQYFPGADFWESHRSPFAPKDIRTSGITQPPVHGFTLLQIYEMADDEGEVLDFLKEMFPKVKALHQYYYDCRDPYEEGLIYIQHPWSSGTDNSPVWDEALNRIQVDQINIPSYERKDLQSEKTTAHGPTDLDYDRYVHLIDICRKANYNDEAIFETSPFLIQDPMFNSILVRSNEALIEIALLLEEDISDMVAWNELTIHSINDKLWDEERALYNAYDLRAEKLIKAESSSALMPLFGGIPTVENAERMVEVMLSKSFSGSEKNPNYLLPSFKTNHPSTSFEKYWRGPLWINMNWMLHKGLTRYLFIEEANMVKEDALNLLEQYGFYKYFDPRKSIVMEAGYGTGQFSWSAALCIDFLLNEELF